jgi:hypothetical protein
MATAIALHGARNVVLRNVQILGFQKGVEAVNSNLLLSGVHIQRSAIGLDLLNSYATIHDTRFTENVIDIVVNKSVAFVIDSAVRKIMEILPNSDYRINSYKVRSIGYKIINTRDIEKKRFLLWQLLDYLKYVGYVWLVYQIIKELLSHLKY